MLFVCITSSEFGKTLMETRVVMGQKGRNNTFSKFAGNIQNFGNYLPDYTASHSRKQNSS